LQTTHRQYEVRSAYVYQMLQDVQTGHFGHIKKDKA